MPELEDIWKPCPAGGCPTHIQGGTDGMLRHLQVIHHPGASLDELEEKYSEQLWPEIAGRADG